MRGGGTCPDARTVQPNGGRGAGEPRRLQEAAGAHGKDAAELLTLRLPGGERRLRRFGLFAAAGLALAAIAATGLTAANGPSVNPNPFDLARANGGKVYVADAGANAILVVNNRGKVDWVARLPEELLPPTAGLKELAGCPNVSDPELEFVCSLPPEIRADPVPTSVAIGPDGALYVGELKGFPAVPGTSRIWRIEPGARHVECGTSSAGGPVERTPRYSRSCSCEARSRRSSRK